MNILIGNTGFVGSNIMANHKFDSYFNSKNINQAFQTSPDLCVYSGVKAEMFLSNSNPELDYEHIENAIDNIKKINPKELVLISTVAVYDTPLKVDEKSSIDESQLSAYGKHRRQLELWVESEIKNSHIIRLPALYGKNLKKNFIYDMVNLTPMMLTSQKFEELVNEDDFILNYYELKENGFYKCLDGKSVKPYFEACGFNALNFTDSRSVYQFYNLAYLWQHIELCLKEKIKLINLSTEPVSAGEVYEAIFKKSFVNELDKDPFNYDVRSIYFENGYIFNKQFVIDDIAKYMEKSI